MVIHDGQQLVLQRPPFNNPTTHTAYPLAFNPDHDICFRHPAYQDAHNIFMILPGLDHPTGGVHHQTALIACAILANNRFDGWFTEDRNGAVLVNTPLDGILQKQDYYFQVSGDHQGTYEERSVYGG
jgi:hypothetical protein